MRSFNRDEASRNRPLRLRVYASFRRTAARSAAQRGSPPATLSREQQARLRLVAGIGAALLTLDRPYFAAKTNSNSAQNRCAPRPADHPAGGDDGGIDMEIQKTARTGDRARRGVDRAGCISADTSVMP